MKLEKYIYKMMFLKNKSIKLNSIPNISFFKCFYK